MKKQFLLLAGTAVLFASCGSNNNNAGQTQAQIDSSVNAKLAEHDAANAAKNDSTLKAIEKEKADAMAKEHHEGGGGKKHEEASPAPAPAPAPTPAPAPAPGGLRSHSDQAQSGTNNAANSSAKPAGGGLRSHSDQNQGK